MTYGFKSHHSHQTLDVYFDTVSIEIGVRFFIFFHLHRFYSNSKRAFAKPVSL